MRAFFIWLLLVSLPLPSAAQSSPDGAWSGQRGNFLQRSDAQAAQFENMGQSFIERTRDNAQNWWNGWESRQPYAGSEGAQSGPAIRTTTALDHGASPLPSGGNSRNQSNRPIEPLPVEEMVRDDFQGLYPYGQ